MKTEKVFSLLEQIIFVIASPMNCSFAILLNIMEIAFIVSTKMENYLSSTPYFLNLSVSDLILGIMIFAVNGSIRWVEITEGDEINNVGFFISGSIVNTCCIVSVLTLTMLTMDRLLAVLKPFQYQNIKQRTRKLICLGIWLLAIIYAFINYFRTGKPTFDNKQYFFVGLFALAGTPFPIISYIMIKRTLKKSRSLSINGAIRPTNVNERRLLSLCTKTFIAYIVSWIPYIIYAVLEWYKVLGISRDFVNRLAFFNIFINSSVNPIIILHHFRIHRIIKIGFVKQMTNNSTQKDVPDKNVT